jgi:hypothetical protein
MNPIALLVFVAVAALVLVVLSGRTRRGGGRSPIGYPYGPQRALFTAAERSFLGVLEQAVGEGHRVFGKVRLADVIKVNSGLSRSARQVAFNRITAKHLDFVLCDPTDLTVVAAIELDDKSHEATSRQQRDSFVDAALGVAGIPVHHFSAKRSYSVHDLRGAILEGVQDRVGGSGAPEVKAPSPAGTYGRP